MMVYLKKTSRRTKNEVEDEPYDRLLVYSSRLVCFWHYNRVIVRWVQQTVIRRNDTAAIG